MDLSPDSVTVADQNDDGHPDLAVSTAMSHTPSILLGKVDGTFQAKEDFTVAHQPYRVVLADLDGDGKPDAVTANGARHTVSVLMNTSD